jgi:hypothetical protein
MGFGGFLVVLTYGGFLVVFGGGCGVLCFFWSHTTLLLFSVNRGEAEAEGVAYSGTIAALHAVAVAII